MKVYVRTPKEVWTLLKESLNTPAFMAGFVCGGVVISIYGAIIALISGK